MVFGWFACPETSTAELIHFPQPHRSSVSMSVLVIELTGIAVVNGSELAAITPDSIIAGAEALKANPSWGMAVWKDDETTGASDGFQEGDTLRFLFWDPILQMEMPATVSEIVQGGRLRFESNGLLVVKLHVEVPEIPPRPPEWIDVPDDVEGQEGGSIEFEIRGRDVNNDRLTIEYISPDLPETATFTDFGNGSGFFQWFPTYFDAGLFSAVFTISDGIFETDAEVRIVVSERMAAADYYELDGPFPNPFNDYTRLRYFIPDDVQFTVETLDSAGRLIGIVDRGFGQGDYSLLFDGSSLASGAYIFRLEAGIVRKYVSGVLLR
jgi:hypothetical protein